MLKSKSFKAVLMVIAFALTLSMSIVLTQKMDVSAKAPQPSYSLSDLSEQTTRYFNYSCSPSGGGVFLGNTTPDWRLAGSLVGFESENAFDNEVTPFYLCSNNANNSCTYKIDALDGAKYTGQLYAFRDKRVNGDTSWLSEFSNGNFADALAGFVGFVSQFFVNGDVPGPENVTSSSTHAFASYARFGYTLSEIGFDSVDANASNTWRLIGGMLMLFVYILASALSSFFSLVIEILKLANPFKIFEYANFTAVADPVTPADAITNGLKSLADMLSHYYNILREIGILIIIPFTLVIALASVFWSPTMNGSIFAQKMKKFGIRFLFVAIGVPLACSLYDTLLTDIGSITAEADGTRIIQSTFFDFEKWAYDDLAIPANVSFEFDEDNDTVTNDTFLKIRDYCYYINTGGNLGLTSLGEGSDATSMVDFESGLFDTVQTPSSGSSEINNTISLLQRYARGDRVAAGSYASHWTNSVAERNKENFYYMFVESADWKYFNPTNASLVISEINDGGGYRRTEDQITTSAMYRFSGGGGTWAATAETNPWVVAGSTDTGYDPESGSQIHTFSSTSGLPALAMYNYLSTQFNKEYIEVFAPDTSGSTFVKPQHYSVNLVGTSYTSILYYFDALVLIGGIVILGYAFGLGMMIGNFKAIFQLIPAVFSGIIGSMRGIATTIIIAIAMILNIVLTGLLWGVASQVIYLVYYLVEKPIAILLANFSASISGGFPITIIYMVVLLVSIIAIAGAVSKLLIWRKALVQSATEMFTAAVNKFCETNAVAPNLLGKDGALKTAAATGLGLAMAGANGAFDGLGERLGFKKPNETEQGNISESILGKQDAEHNPFGVVKDGSDDPSITGSGNMTGDDSVHTEDGALTDADGNPVTDADGNPIGTDENGNLVDAEGNPITDENGNPVSASGLHFDQNGNLVDSSGHAVTDANGNSFGTGVPLSQHDGSVHQNTETGELSDANGNTITDGEGNAITTDEAGYLTDSNGNRLTDSNGNPIKASSTRVDGHGNLRDSRGNLVKGAGGKPVGSGASFGNNINRVSSGGNGSDAVYKNSRGNLTDADGNEFHVTDADGNEFPMRVNEDGNLTDSMGHEVMDANGNPIPADSLGVNSDGNLTDANGDLITDENNNPVSVTDSSGGSNTERAENTTDEAESYLDSPEAQNSINSFMGGAVTGGAVTGGTTGAGSGGNTTTQSGGYGTASSGLALPNGNIVNSIDMPEGAIAGVATSQGIIPKEHADAQGLTGMSGAYTADGEFIPGQVTDDGGFVPGITTESGEFVPGVMQDGQFVPGGFDSSGNFVAGVYTDNGFTAGTFDSDGRFVPSGGTAPAGMGGKALGGSIVDKGDGSAVMTDGSGGEIPVVADSAGNFGVTSGSDVLKTQMSSSGGLSLSTGNGGQIAIGTNGAGQMTLGSNGVAASSQNGQIMLDTGTANDIPVRSDSNGYASIRCAGGGTAGGGRISLVENADGGLALATGDGSAIALDTTESGQLVMRTASGEGVALTANSHGGLCAVDKSGNEVPLSVVDGHLAMGSTSSNSVAITADENGNVMVGGNGSSGSHSYITSTSDGGFGVNSRNIRVTGSGGVSEVASSNGVAQITATSSGGVSVGGSTIGSSGAIGVGVQDSNGEVNMINSGTRVTTNTGSSTTIEPSDSAKQSADYQSADYSSARASSFSQSVRIAAANTPTGGATTSYTTSAPTGGATTSYTTSAPTGGGSGSYVVVSQGNSSGQSVVTTAPVATNVTPNVRVSGVQMGGNADFQSITKSMQTVVQSTVIANAALSVMEGNTSAIPTVAMGYQAMNNNSSGTQKSGSRGNMTNVNSRPKANSTNSASYKMINPKPSNDERNGFDQKR